MAEIKTPNGTLIGLIVEPKEPEKKADEAPVEKKRVGRPPKTEK